MSDNSFLSDLASLMTIITSIGTSISKLYPRFQRWGIKRTANLISGLGLIAKGLPMVALSGVAQDQMFSATGFILPLVTPSIHGLTNEQASIFGNFSNFFYSTLGIGILGIAIGVLRINKFFSLGNNESPRIYQ
jgi:hypothetical protein